MWTTTASKSSAYTTIIWIKDKYWLSGNKSECKLPLNRCPFTLLVCLELFRKNRNNLCWKKVTVFNLKRLLMTEHSKKKVLEGYINTCCPKKRSLNDKIWLFDPKFLKIIPIRYYKFKILLKQVKITDVKLAIQSCWSLPSLPVHFGGFAIFI